MYKVFKSGFTIVELLIVIVVIAVLASISVVAFNGFQTRSKNTTQNNAAAQYVKLIRLYRVQNGTWPSLGSGCLGTNYVDTNANGVADCGDNADIQVNSSLNTALLSVGSLPDAVIDQIQGSGSIRSAGITYKGITVNNEVWINWYVRGSGTDCKAPSGSSAGFIPGNDGARAYCQYFIAPEN